MIDVKSFRETLNNNFVLVLTSNSVERDAVGKLIEISRPAKVGMDTSGCDLGLLEEMLVLHVSGESGASKPRSIARIATELLVRPELPKPALVVLCGFCWGNPDKVKPLDVIISDKIYSSNYQEATVSGLTRRCKPFASSVDIDDVEDINRSLVQHGFSVWTGAMASLETRLEDNRLRDDLIKENPQIFGGEMEAFGFLPSCKEPWLVVKAVSDFGGNDFSRTSQQQAALHAANTLKPLISALKRKRFLLDVEATPSQKLLLDLLRGNTVLLRSEDITAENLNDHLNNNIGVSVEYKLRSYSSDKEYGSEFMYEFCDLILELMQNSLRHGKANEVSVQFTEKSIIFKDDGDPFNPNDLSGNNGGAKAWKRIFGKYISDDLSVSVKHNKGDIGNIYKFSLKRVYKLLADARTKCQIQIIPDSIGRSFGRSESITFNENCEALYFDAGSIRMTSRRNIILKALKPLVDSGKKIFVACRSEEQAEEIKSDMQYLSISDVTVLISPR